MFNGRVNCDVFLEKKPQSVLSEPLLFIVALILTPSFL